jgi:hypothetical protein
MVTKAIRGQKMFVTPGSGTSLTAGVGASVSNGFIPLHQLSGGGYTFPDTDWDDAGFVVPYGAGFGSVNAAATTFVIPADLDGMRFRLGFAANAFPISGYANSNASVQIWNDIGVYPRINLGVPMFWDNTINHNLINGGVSAVWEGVLAAGDVIYFDTGIQGGGGSDAIGVSELFIEAIGNPAGS